MSGTEYKALRERLGMTQALFAQAVGRSRKIINEREQADEVPLEAALAAELLALRPTPRSRKGTNDALSGPRGGEGAPNQQPANRPDGSLQ